jgi:curli production assembly/transport component CsgG
MLKILLIIATLFLGGCASVPKIEDPKLSLSPLQEKFDNIKSLDGPAITIAVYSFTDKTGQRKPSEKFSQLSSAVTQGAEVWVIQALKSVGNGTWFQVVERIGLDNMKKKKINN